MRNLPKGWEWATLETICSKVTDGSHGTPKFIETGYPFVSITDIKQEGIDFSGAKRIAKSDYEKLKGNCNPRKGDVLFTKDGTVGKVIEVDFDREFVVLSSVAILRPITNHVLPKYLVYALKNKDSLSQASRTMTGTALTRIILKNLRTVRVPVPPLDTQRKIVAILDKAEETRRLRARANELTQTMLQSVFLEMFGDPVTNPKGWDTTPIGSVTSLISSGSTPLGGSSVYTDHGILFIRSQNVLMNHLSKEDMVNITHETHKNMRRTWVKKGDILFNITGASIGRVAWFNGEDDSANVNQHVCIIRPIKERIVTEFLSYHLSMQSYQNKIMANQSGATRQAFNFSQIREFEMIAPEYSLQKQFAEAVWEVQKTQSCQKAARCKNDDLFNAIVTKAFTGELFA